MTIMWGERAKPYHRPDHAGIRDYPMGGDFMTGTQFSWKIRGTETSGDFSFVEVVFKKGADAPAHLHHREDEAFYILEGEFTFYVGEDREPTVAGPGSFVWAPRGIRHQYKVTGPTDVRALVLITPAGAETFFDKASEVQIKTPEALEQLIRMCLDEYGIEVYQD